MEGFSRSLAFLVAIDRYKNGLPELRTPVSDAEDLARLLREEHGFETEVIANERATARRLRSFLKKLPSRIGSDDRVIFYFAGHGTALESDAGPQGFILPQDASRTNRRNLLPMLGLQEQLSALPCRHMLVVLDCCFAGAFRWGALRHVVPAAGRLHKQRYQWFIEDAAWQAIASAAHDQEAIDVVGGQPLGKRDDAREHSPFAAALIRGLKGAADLPIGGATGDGVITATELYLYLESELLPKKADGFRQTPTFWPLKKHDKGQFVFLVPGKAIDLPEAPVLDADANPWRGLEPYEARHSELFFGRGEVTGKLAERIARERFVVVTGPSGIGKSSLVKAGLLPRLTGEPSSSKKRMRPIVVRPGPEPFASLARALRDATPEGAPDETALRSDHRALADWAKSPSVQGEVLLVLDQAEELITMTHDEMVTKSYLALFDHALGEGDGHFRAAFTVRSEFEPQFAQSPLEARWATARFPVPPMTQDELRRVIEGPAAVKVMRFEPGGLVDDLVNEVVQMPGALPLLSFALSQMYAHYLKRRSDDRALTKADYDALKGGVTGSLRVRANELVGVWDKPHEATTRRVLEVLLSGEAGDGHALDVKDPIENARVERVLSRMEDANLIVKRQEGERSLRLAEGAISPTASDLLARVNQAFDLYQATARRVLERFVSVDVGEFTRRRVARQEFEVADAVEQARVDKILDRLDEARLLVTDEIDGRPHLELAHDALIRGWDRLLNWVRQDTVLIADLRRLGSDAEVWKKDPRRQSGRLWDDPARLDAVKKLQTAAAPGLNRTEGEFARASVRRANRQYAIRAGAVLTVVALSLAIGVLALFWREQRDESLSRELAAQSSIAAEANDVGAALLLSVAAVDLRSTREARQSLLSNLTTTQHLRRLLPVDPDTKNGVAISADAELIVVAGAHGGLDLIEFAGGIAASLDTAHNGAVSAVEYGTACDCFVTVSKDGTARTWSRKLNAIESVTLPESLTTGRLTQILDTDTIPITIDKKMEYMLIGANNLHIYNFSKKTWRAMSCQTTVTTTATAVILPNYKCLR